MDIWTEMQLAGIDTNRVRVLHGPSDDVYHVNYPSGETMVAFGLDSDGHTVDNPGAWTATLWLEPGSDRAEVTEAGTRAHVLAHVAAWTKRGRLFVV
jgi:hypothetical protein